VAVLLGWLFGARPLAAQGGPADPGDVVTVFPGAPAASVSGRSGGEVDARLYGDTDAGPCVGFIADQPNHVLQVTEAVERLELLVDSSADTTLVVLGPAGMKCNDDSYGLNPAISGAFPAGVYQIFVGSYSYRARSSYRLSVTAQPRRVPNPAWGEGRDGDLTLAPGFSPDAELSGTSGGGTSAVALGATPSGACTGFIGDAPNHVLYLTGDFDALSIRVSAGGDTTLVVRGGAFLRCNDDSVGLDPAVTGEFPAGTYQIFVGSYRYGEYHPYRIAFSAASPPQWR
jgi:hypothetical protein